MTAECHGISGSTRCARAVARLAAALVSVALLQPFAVTAQPASAVSLDPPKVYPSVQVSTDPSPTRAYNQPNVLIDPKDPNVLVIAGANYNAGDCVVFVSRDKGQSWTESRAIARPPQYTTCVRPDLGPYLGAAFGPDGTLYLASAADNLGGQQDVNTLYLARSTDLGNSWQFTIIHAGTTNHAFQTEDGSTITGGEHFSLIQMATDPSNPKYVYVGARYGIASRTPPHGLFGIVPLEADVAVSADGGKTFSQPTNIVANIPRTQIYGDFIPSLAVAKNGTVYAFTRDKSAPSSAPLNPSAPAGSPGTGARQLLSTSTNHGKSWKTATIDSSSVHCPACTQADEPSGAVGAGAGSVYAVWAQSDGSSTGPNNIMFRSSTNGGKTWSSRITLNDDRSRVDHWAPGVQVAPDGRIDVAWIDFRSSLTYNAVADTKTEQYWDVYYTYSNDGGKTWAKNIRVSDRAMDEAAGYTTNSSYGLFSAVTMVSTNGTTYVAWSDSRGGSAAAPVEDYYFTRVAHKSEATSMTTTSTGKAVLGGVVGFLIATVAMLILFIVIVRRRRSM